MTEIYKDPKYDDTSERQPSTELVPVDQGSQVVLATIFGLGQGGELHNFTGDKMQQFRMIAKATGGQLKGFDDLKGNPIDIQNFFIHAVQLSGSPPGEVIDATRTVLVDSSGEMYAFVSDGIAKSLGRIVSAFGMGPWPSPFKFDVLKLKASGKNFTYALVPAA